MKYLITLLTIMSFNILPAYGNTDSMLGLDPNMGAGFSNGGAARSSAPVPGMASVKKALDSGKSGQAQAHFDPTADTGDIYAFAPKKSVMAPRGAQHGDSDESDSAQ